MDERLILSTPNRRFDKKREGSHEKYR